MPKTQIELLVLFQDLDLMLKEATEDEENLGFPIEGYENLEKTLKEIKQKISVRYLRAYERLNQKFRRPIVPVKDDTCLGCCARLPTSFGARGRDDQGIYTCENCGRLLYWID